MLYILGIFIFWGLYILGIYSGGETATRDVLEKKLFLQILQNLQENICARVSFLIKLQARGQRPATLLKNENLTQVFSCQFCKFCRNTFFMEHLWVTASGYEIVIFDSFE